MAHTPASLLAASAEEAGHNLGDVFALLDEPMTTFQRIDLLVRVPDGLFRQRQSLEQVDVDDHVVDHTLQVIHVDVPASLALVKSPSGASWSVFVDASSSFCSKTRHACKVLLSCVFCASSSASLVQGV